MGLAELFNRNTQYTATDTATGISSTFTVVDNVRPDWAAGAYSGGMAIPGAWRSALLLSDLIGSVPWHGYRQRAGHPAERIEPTPPMLDQPSPPDPRVVTMTSWALDLIWHGNAIGIVADRNRDGWPLAFVPVPAQYVQVRRQPYDDPTFPVGTVVYNIGQRQFGESDVFHVKGPCEPGALRGMGVLENHMNGTLSLAAEQSRQARNTAGGSGVPTGVLTVDDTPDDPLEQDEADDVKASWMRAQRERSVAVLNARTKFEALSWNPTETQLLDARRFSLHELALIFGLDPSWLGVSGDSMTYSNIEQQAVNLARYSMAGHFARFEQTLSLHMPRGTWAKANLDALLRADTKTRYEAHSLGITAGFLTPDEARGLEDRPPLTAAQREAMRPPPAAPPAPAAQPPTG